MITKRPLVLILDDEIGLVEPVRDALEKQGCDVLIASDGAVGLGLVRSADPDAVIVDAGLNHLDGIEICRRLRAFSDASVLLLTARADEMESAVGQSVGADECLLKPVCPTELVTRVWALLRPHWLSSVALPTPERIAVLEAQEFAPVLEATAAEP